jgi:4-carboxymuconolactone decarboxylase
LDNGVAPQEIGELITQLAFYSGWPNAISAVEDERTARHLLLFRSDFIESG